MIRSRLRSLRHAAPFVALLLLASCDVLGLTIGGSGRRAELERQRAKWARQQITSYRLVYRRDCECGEALTSPTAIEVRGGAVAAATYADGDPVPSHVRDDLPTVDALFAMVAEAIQQEADLLEVTYDASRGYPTRIAIDYRFNAVDDEVTHSVLSLEIILPPIVP
jgi:hypothetical protein